MKRNNEKGFTLIELVAVIFIITIIAAIAIPTIWGWIGHAENAADKSNLDILNRITQYCAADEGVALDTVFSGLVTDGERMDKLIAGAYISSRLVPEQKNASFSWNPVNLKWEIFEGDPIIIDFKDSVQTSSILYSTFLEKSPTFNYGGGTQYNPNSWNGYLEKLLEVGDVASNIKSSKNDGTNTIDYYNPYSGIGSVIDFYNWEKIKSYYPSYIPPAIFITNISNFDYYASDHTYIQDNLNTLKGTMIFYKANSQDNSETQVYYIKEDGSLSDLTSVAEVLD